jgi:hypothetical protein
VPFQTRALEVLARWRVVERALEGIDAGTVEADALRIEAVRLRDEYQELILAARRVDAPEPFPPVGYDGASMCCSNPIDPKVHRHRHGRATHRTREPVVLDMKNGPASGTRAVCLASILS